jgi:transcriptional regulator with XRE-family HTH domain
MQNVSKQSAAKSRISQLLLEIRKAFSLSQNEMANNLGVTRSAYQHYERGERDTPWEIAELFFRNYQIDPVLAFFENGEEIIDDRNLRIIRIYQEANDFVRDRAALKKKALTKEKEKYLSETIAQELMDMSTPIAELGERDNLRFEQMIDMVA